jgi:hypothetical protein
MRRCWIAVFFGSSDKIAVLSGVSDKSVSAACVAGRPGAVGPAAGRLPVPGEGILMRGEYPCGRVEVMVFMANSVFAALCAAVAGLCYITYSVVFFFDPCRTSTNAHMFMSLFNGESRYYMWRSRIMGVGSAVALGMIPGAVELVRGGDFAPLLWASGLAFIGFALSSVSNLRSLQILPVVHGDHERSGEEAKIALARSISYIHLDPRGWFTFGGVGVWVAALSWYGLHTAALPLALVVIGIVLGLFFITVVVAGVFHKYAVFGVVAGAGGLVLAPVWFLWTAWLLL